jgi:hypothetical protein
MSHYGRSVFINVPFDRPYRKLFDALIFSVHSCGFLSRCALEAGDSSQIRLEKLYGIIGECGYGIHDLSRTTLDSANRLPRFNMPLELGIFLGAKRYGDDGQRRKSCLILDRDRYRYQIYCSDIAGQDVRAHGNRVEDAIVAVRDWLRSESYAKIRLPGGRSIVDRYVHFRRELPQMCYEEDLDIRRLGFLDYRMLVVGWLDANPG